MYGFRLYTWNISAGINGRKKAKYSALKIPASLGATVVDHIRYCWESLGNTDVLTGTPITQGPSKEKISVYADSDGSKGDPRMVYGGFDISQPGLGVGGFEYGRVGLYQDAIGKSKSTRKNIGDHAAVNPFRAVFVSASPREDGSDQGIAVIENIHRRNPAAIIEKWLALASEELVSSGAIQGSKSMRLHLTEMSDRDHLQKMLDDADKISVKLFERSVGNGNGGHPTTAEVKFEELVHGDKTKESIKNLIIRWISRGKENQSKASATNHTGKLKSTAIQPMSDDGNGGLVFEDEIDQLKNITMQSETDIPYNDGYVSVTKGDEKTRISPRVEGDIFNYIIGVSRPSTKMLEDHAFEIVGDILTSLEMDCSIIEGWERDEILEST